MIVDVVVNHAGYDSELVTEHPEWFHDEADCAATDDPEKDCPLAGLPDFDQDEPGAVAYLNDALRFLQRETGVDGFRLDTVKHVDDAYWRAAFAPGGALDPAAVWSVGEVFTGDIDRLAFYLDDVGVPGIFDFPLYFRIKDHLSNPGGNLDDVAAIFAADGAYDDPRRLVTFVDNHDVPRFVSEATGRGVGRPEALERLDAALSLIYAARGTPSVYYGTEIGMAGRGDPYGVPPGEGNREDMDFGALAGSSLDERLADLAAARRAFPALRDGVQEELWRPNGGAPVLAFRRLADGEAPVVAVLNNGDAALDLAALGPGGIPLFGTFDPDGAFGDRGRNGRNCSRGNDRSGKCLRGLVEVTGRATDLAVAGDRLVGTVPPRTLLIVAAPPGDGLGSDPDLGNVTDLAALAGDGAVGLSWTPADDGDVSGTRIYLQGEGDAEETRWNLAPLPAEQTSVVISGLTNGEATTFRVVTVSENGESVGAPTVAATPDPDAVSRVTLRAVAPGQGDGPLEVRRFDTGSQLEYPMVPVGGGVWETTVELPLFREIAFKFGNDAPEAKNFGYEGPGQPDRRVRLDAAELTVEGTYDFITVPAPDAAVTGVTSSGGLPLGAVVVESDVDPALYYAISGADGAYALPLPAGTTTTLTARKGGYLDVSTGATAPASGVDLELPLDVAPVYAIDGDLSDWSPRATLINPGFDEGFGPDNLFLELLIDWDEAYLYLGWSYRVAEENSAIVHLDSAPGGVTSVDAIDAWRRLADFADPVDAFVAQFRSDPPQLWEIVATTNAEPAPGMLAATVGSAPAFTTETAIPWTSLGYAARPDATIGLHAGIYGGDDYGAGDIAPNPNSTPAAPANAVAGSDQDRRATFAEAFEVTVTP